MNEAMLEVLKVMSVLTPIILALTELIKLVTGIPAKYVPLVALAFGLLVGYTTGQFTDLNTELRLWSGVLSALSATGLFEAYKHIKPETTSK